MGDQGEDDLSFILKERKEKYVRKLETGDSKI